uniref:Glycosyltransferase n=1 Tax=Desulfovibrio sp. U5L TaxID=596152 RepID=I2Q7M1_9BACT
MHIVHLNTQDMEGGAARVALRLAQGQRRAGHAASLLVGRKNLPGDISFRFDLGDDPDLRAFCEAARLPYLHFQGSHGLTAHPVVAAADVLHVHNLHFDYANPFSLSFLSHAKPTIWTWHDLFPTTGLCLHPGGCPAWERGCTPCDRQRLNDPWDGKIVPPPVGETALAGPGLSLAWKRLLYAHCHLTVVCPSEWMRRQAEHFGPADLPVTVVRNGVDTAVFRPGDRRKARERLGLPQDAFVLGAVAVLGALDNPLKGGKHLLAVLDYVSRRHPGCLLLNVGADGPPPHPLVRNIPYLENLEDVAQTYAAMDAFVHAAAAESFCLVAAEAMACGLPVAAFAAGPLPEVVVDGVTGWLCPPGDASDLAEACLRLAQDPDCRRAMGQAGRERAVALFDFVRTQDAYQRLYEAETQDRHRTPPVVRAFDLATLPAILKTPAFLRAEGEKTGRDLARLAPTGDLAARLLEELPTQSRDLLSPLLDKARKTRRVFDLRVQGRMPEALALLEELITAWPDDLPLTRTLGVTLGLMGRPREAVATLQRCLEADPPLSDAWLNIADVHLRAGDLEACGRALRAFASIDPDLKGFNLRRGLLLAAQGRPRSAVRALLTELRLHGTPEVVTPLRQAWARRHE